MNVEEKLAYFSKCADEEAERQRLKIQDDIDEKMKELVKTITDDAEKKAVVRLREETSRIEQAKNKDIIRASANSKKAVLDVRNRLLDTLFESAADRIREYTKSSEYARRLMGEITDSAARFGHIKVYLMERDSSLPGELPDNCEVVSVKDDFLGGFKLLIAERNAIEDHTYLARLKAIREDFNELKLFQAAENGGETGK